MAVLHKNYRSTRQILEYINSVGYLIHIPDHIKSGIPVEEHLLESREEEIVYVQNVIEKNTDTTVGVLAKSVSYIAPFREKFKGKENVRILTINEAQGVEFDVVCLVGVRQEFFTVSDNVYNKMDLIEERKRVDVDLLYVAL